MALSIAAMLGSSANVIAFYLLAQGRSRSNALISLLTGRLHAGHQRCRAAAFGRQAVGWSACFGMIAQMVTTVILLRRGFSLVGMWSRVIHFVLMPLGVGIAMALTLWPSTRAISKCHSDQGRIMSLPMFAEITVGQQYRVIDLVRRF